MLDASDTGTGKTYVTLFLCRELGIVPLVIGPKSARAGWAEAAELVGVELEFVNYEKIKPRLTKKLVWPKTRFGPLQGPFFDTHRESEWTVEVPWGKGSFVKWKQEYHTIVFDEVHRCGGGTSLNSKLLIAAKRQAEFIIALSATAADDPRQMKALGYALGLHGLSKKTRTQMNYMSWLMRHGVTPGIFGGYDFTADETKVKKVFARLNAEVFPHKGARMRKDDIPGFPQTTIDVKLLTDFTDKAKDLTEELHAIGDGNAAEGMGLRQKLEVLKIPHFIDLALDYGLTSKVVLFVNFTEPLEQIYEKLGKEFGHDHVGFISGAQTGARGETERRRTIERCQRNELDALVVNSQAGGESCNLHDPTGQVERTALISPCESGRQLKQIFGRVHRDGGARSLQLLTYFADTYEAEVAKRLKQKNFNLDILNDGELAL